MNSLASIIINNYNYARFLREAVESALNQTYPHTEVIVVDDGSTDASREIISSYGDRIIPILKRNGGQNSALNAGFSASRGNVILLLDSDDTLLPTAVEAASEALAEQDVVKVHWPWVEWNDSSRETGRIWWKSLPDVDLRDLLLREGPNVLAGHLPSGNAYARGFLENIFPLPDVCCDPGCSPSNAERAWAARPGPDLYLAALAPLYGLVKEIAQPQACYRMHGANGYQSLKFEERLRFDVDLFEYVSNATAGHCARMGISVDREQWRAKSWAYRVQQAAGEIVSLIPKRGSFILVDEDGWKTDPFLCGRKRIPFLERDGQYWGRPPDDVTAIQELERLRKAGADFVVFPWSTFWWLGYYAELARHLRRLFPCLVENEDLIIFDLREGSLLA
jgi:glycosyltransferase involved in cell wall biosynthesis